MIHDLPLLLFVLIGGHFFLDFSGQGPYLAEAKNRHTTHPGFPWPLAMLAHTTMHGAFVAYMTGSVLLGLVELGIHFLVDWVKCNKRISFVVDQLIHIGCKLVYVILLYKEIGL